MSRILTANYLTSRDSRATLSMSRYSRQRDSPQSEGTVKGERHAAERSSHHQDSERRARRVAPRWLPEAREHPSRPAPELASRRVKEGRRTRAWHPRGAVPG